MLSTVILYETRLCILLRATGCLRLGICLYTVDPRTPSFLHPRQGLDQCQWTPLLLCSSDHRLRHDSVDGKSQHQLRFPGTHAHQEEENTTPVDAALNRLQTKHSTADRLALPHSTYPLVSAPGSCNTQRGSAAVHTPNCSVPQRLNVTPPSNVTALSCPQQLPCILDFLHQSTWYAKYPVHWLQIRSAL